MTGRRDEYVKRAEELLRGSRFEQEVHETREEIDRSGATHPSGAPEDERLAILLRTLGILYSTHSLDEIVPRLMGLAIRLLAAERGIIFLLDDKNQFHAVAEANTESQCLADAMDYSENILRRAAEDHVVWSGNALSDKRFSQYESIAAFNIKSFMCVPLKRQGKIVGTIYIDNRTLENSFGDKDLRFLQMLAEQAGVAIENARLYDRLRAENNQLRTEIKRSIGERVIVGDDPKIKRILEIVDRVADSNATVLVTGESGTGKEMIARAIHQQSPRLGQPLVTLNCAAIPEHLLESELFGYVKGAFTGAAGTKAGKFEAADHGTLFLDEIGDMSFPLQAKILRVLQEGRFDPLGGNHSKDVDVRIVAATNRNLAKMVEEGTFREDLYYRLNVIVLDLPPLRSRPDDIPMLALHFLAKCSTGKTQAREFSPGAVKLMQSYSWPGNIRELENCVMRLALLAPNEVVAAEDLAPYLEGRGSTVPRPAAATLEPQPVARLDDLERQAILGALERFDGNRTVAAQALGISVRKLQYKIKEYQEAGLLRE